MSTSDNSDWRGDWTRGGGEMGARIRALDWSATPLGHPRQWPQTLRTAVRILLTSQHPMFIWWGPELIQFYNDAYRLTMGPERHPSALGQRGRECWKEIWHIIGSQIDTVMAGEGATWHQDQLVPVTRHGRREDVYWTYGYSPIDDATAPMGVGGVLVVCNDVTEQVLARRTAEMRAAEALDSLSHLRSTFEQAPGFMALLRGHEHVFEFVNHAYSQLIGVRDIIGLPVRAALPDLAGQGYFEILDRVYTSGKPYVGRALPTQLQRDAGSEPQVFYLDFLYQPMRNPDGAVSGIFVQGNDVTARYRAEQALAASRARVTLLLENSTDFAFVIFDPDGMVVEWKGAAERITGFTAADVCDKTLHVIFTPEDRAAGVPERELALAAADGRAEDKRWHLRKDGSRFFADGVMVSIVDPAGVHSGFGKVFRDATARTQREEQIASLLAAADKQSRLLRQVAETSRAVNASLSLESITRSAVEDARSILDAEGAQLDLLPEDATRQAVRIETGSSTAPAGSTLSIPLISYSGKNLGNFHVFGRSDFTPENESVLTQLAAITAAAIQNARFYEALQQQDRRKDEFLATLAHELRNPLAPLRNGIHLLRRTESHEALADVREMMDRQLQQLVRLVDDLLDMSRVSQGKITLQRQHLDIAAIIHTALETSRPLIAAGHHQLHVQTPTQAVFVDVDEMRMAQVISNLLNNAAKYTPDGGRVEVGAERRGQQVAVFVRDNGIGIVPDMQSYVFELFSQAHRAIDRAQGGLGIGLALVRRLVELHGGSVTVSSAGTNQGAEFTVLLPLSGVQQSEAAVAVDSAPAVPAVNRSLRVLVIDDNIDAAVSLATLIGFSGAEVMTGHSAGEARRLAVELQPDVIFLDIGLPGMNGYEVAAELRNIPALKTTTIAALTGWGSVEDRKRSKAAGFDYHLTKPVDPAQVETLLRDKQTAL